MDGSYLVVTPLVIPALWLMAGFSLAGAIYFLSFGLLRRSEQMYTAFGLVSLVIGLHAGLLALTLLADIPERAIFFYRLRTCVTCAFFPILVWFVAWYSGTAHPTRWFAGTAILFVPMVIVNLVAPSPLPFSEIYVTTVRMPWGEQINRVYGTLVAWSPLVFGSIYAVFAWALWRCIAMYRHGERTEARILAVFIAISFVNAIYRYLVDLSYVQGIYLGDLVNTMLVVFMSVRLALVLRGRAVSTETTLNQLQTEVERRHRAEGKLQHLAYNDFLTDLPNRASLAERLHEMLNTERGDEPHGALLLLDLDHFKVINDALGHDVGDELLRLVSARLRDQLRTGDVVARMGGDEFAVLMQNVSKDERRTHQEARGMAERLIGAITRPFQLGEREVRIGASIGVCIFRAGQWRHGEIVSKADLALYRAKAKGRNATYFYTPGLQQEVDERLEIEKGLRHALANDELGLHFQPQVDRVGRLTGVEALLRWRGRVQEDSSTRFVAVAEETGLIHSIGEWVLKTVCAHIRAWDKRGNLVPMRISINVSAWQIARPDFATAVLRTLKQQGVAPERLALEITETAVMYDPDAATANMMALSEAGIELSIDDFGCGYSSLSYLQRLPLHQLKIDRQFVSELTGTREHSLVASIIAIGHQRGLSVIAEGVETEAQQRTLAAMQCDGFQGYFVCPPLAEPAFVEWVKQNSLLPSTL